MTLGCLYIVCKCGFRARLGSRTSFGAVHPRWAWVGVAVVLSRRTVEAWIALSLRFCKPGVITVPACTARRALGATYQACTIWEGTTWTLIWVEGSLQAVVPLWTDNLLWAGGTSRAVVTWVTRPSSNCFSSSVTELPASAVETLVLRLQPFSCTVSSCRTTHRLCHACNRESQIIAKSRKSQGCSGMSKR